MKNDLRKKSRRSVSKRHKKTKKNRLFYVLLIFFAGLLVYHFGISQKDKEAVSSVAEEVIEQATTMVEKEKDYKPEIDAIIAANPGVDISVSYVNLKKPAEIQSFGLETPFTAASTTKMISAVCLLKDVEAGKYTLNTTLGGNTVNWQLKQMINRSNNDSWELINSKIGYSRLQNCAKGIGLSSYKNLDNTVNSSDIARLLSNLYEGKSLNASNRELLLLYMQNTINEELIPPALPETATFWHKYGNFGGNLHDVAIVKDGDREYVIVIYTQRDGANYNIQTQIIREITSVFSKS